MGVDSSPEVACRIECRPQVVQYCGQQGGLLRRWLHSLLEALQRLLEAAEAAVGHTHRQVQLAWWGSEVSGGQSVANPRITFCHCYPESSAR